MGRRAVGRRAMSSDERRARNAARMRRWRAKRKEELQHDKPKPKSKPKSRPVKPEHSSIFTTLRKAFRGRLPTALLRAGSSLTQSGTNMILNVSSWIPRYSITSRPTSHKKSRQGMLSSTESGTNTSEANNILPRNPDEFNKYNGKI